MDRYICANDRGITRTQRGTLLLMALVGLMACHTQTTHLSRDGRAQLATLPLQVYAKGPVLRVPMFRRGNELHLAGMAGKRYSLVLANMSRSAVQIEIVATRKTPLQKTLKDKRTIALGPGKRATIVGGEEDRQEGALYQFPAWEFDMCGAMELSALGHIRIIAKDSNGKSHAMSIRYGHCQVYQRHGICPTNCPCAVQSKRQRTTANGRHLPNVLMRRWY